MKMSRGEIVGFVGALGYDYDPATKTMTVNQEGAKIVQYIFNRYVSGVGTSTIARELEEMGVPNPSGSKTWHQTTVAGIIRNEKYVGDLLQGKTFTVDPISHRRLDNLGESDKYLLKDHHEAIVSREVFDKAQEILAKRGKCRSNARLRKDEYRTLYTNKYAFSCKCRCGYCGAILTRRTWHGGKYRKTIWLCITASKTGKKNCPNCKAIPEEALMSAFVESYNIMTRDHKDVLDEFLSRVESTLSDSDVSKRIEKEKDKLKNISYKLNNLLDMHLEGKIDFETFEKKRDTLQNQLSEKKIEIAALEDRGNSKLDLEDRISFMREKLETETTIKEFDRQVFESIVDYVIVGGYNEEGNADPSMITFVYRTGFKDRKDMEMQSWVDTYLLTIDDYNEYAGTNISLTEDEILIYNSDKQWREGDTLDFLEKEYKVAGTVNYEDVYYIINPTMALFEHEILVFSNGEQLVQAANILGENFEISFKAEEKTYFYNLYSGTFFVGIFLALLFLMATVMIIYYKQMSEGFEDQKRFHILANVGLTEREARKTIQTQVMLLFFLPVGAAMIHMIVASNVIRLFLRMILIVDALTFNAAIAVVCVIFLLVYALVYKVTSREYYKIVNAG